MSGIDGRTASSFDALELLANPTRLQAKLDQLKAAEVAAHEQIALAGPASEIVKIRGEIDGLKELAADALKGAKADAAEIVAKAKEEAMEIMADAEAEASRVDIAAAEQATKTEEAYKEAAGVLANNKQAAADLDQREKTLNDYKAKVDAAMADIESRESLLLQEKSKLASVREYIEQNL
jgi:hypothetical protein